MKKLDRILQHNHPKITSISWKFYQPEWVERKLIVKAKFKMCKWIIQPSQGYQYQH